ncbi:MAG: hypothetical protein ACREOW_07255 [Thermodesulfobacteriota bacterium]
MRRLFLVGAITTLLVAIGSVAWAAINLNSSKSNIYRVTYDTTAVTPTQAAAVLQELGKIGPGVNEATVRKLLQQQGVNLSLIKLIRIIPAAQRRERIPAILILTDPAHEAPAIADFDPGVPADKGPSKKSTQ